MRRERLQGRLEVQRESEGASARSGLPVPLSSNDGRECQAGITCLSICFSSRFAAIRRPPTRPNLVPCPAFLSARIRSLCGCTRAPAGSVTGVRGWPRAQERTPSVHPHPHPPIPTAHPPSVSPSTHPFLPSIHPSSLPPRSFPPSHPSSCGSAVCALDRACASH